MAAAGLGVALVPELALTPEVRRGARPLAPGLARRLFASVRDGAEAHPVLAAMLAALARGRDWREQIALAVDERCREHGLDRRRLTRDQRGALVEHLDDRGLFATRNAADHAAHALGVSRATVYTLLKEVRGERDAARLPA